MNLSKLWEMVKVRQAWYAVHEVTESDMTKWLNNNSNFMNLNIFTLTSPQKKPIWNQKHKETYSQATRLISTHCLLPPLPCSHSTEKWASPDNSLLGSTSPFSESLRFITSHPWFIPAAGFIEQLRCTELYFRYLGGKDALKHSTCPLAA